MAQDQEAPVIPEKMITFNLINTIDQQQEYQLQLSR